MQPITVRPDFYDWEPAKVSPTAELRSKFSHTGLLKFTHKECDTSYFIPLTSARYPFPVINQDGLLAIRYLTVITSYSIHYTKLYEEPDPLRKPLDQRGDMALVARVQHRQAIAHHDPVGGGLALRGAHLAAHPDHLGIDRGAEHLPRLLAEPGPS